MISRIQVRCYGSSAGDCEQQLTQFHAQVEQSLAPRTVSAGEQVIERNLTEPKDSSFAYEGRTLLYPDIREDAVVQESADKRSKADDEPTAMESINASIEAGR